MSQLKSMFLLMLAMTTIVLYLVWSSQGKELKRFAYQENVVLCHEQSEDTRELKPREDPMIYFITPSYPRREQVAELTRLGQTLMHVPNLHWIVADDNRLCNAMVMELLKKFGIPFTHISSPMPEMYRKASTVPRGVANRRAALHWIQANVKQGVLYFGDDDNTFDLRLFNEIRSTKKVSMFPVGLIGDYGVSSPVIKDGKVIGFYDSWPAKRTFPVDMAGFAVNIDFFLKHPEASMPYKAGYEEDHFLKSLNLTLDDIEPKADGCTQVLVWHTQTTKRPAPTVKIHKQSGTSLKELLHELDYLGMAYSNSIKGVKSMLSKDGKTVNL
ncbi:hypothetical protein FOCC_FOCC000503 [Frankliniella occidentalis]|uniref:Galactosylgalactosylxylosylprotein 3-beta-glucuronosyltransferase n=1 Tax=Frankliniella occidentalis TaxID=133901 RepID=A0A6J1S3U4_FRAOC|nr:galactosylgalactosylxylosylprotein 3-beta-glucuronosyltransferase S [Frankliniella occidentalis]XP_026275703.1 galactosylgalactosylxylosylprotein 3-beta-glucuronosyltransferase S [Frankliniella occidentalis]XP_052123131.1 galactosylgalactosylxylosylprotein 3-beta-glucuronosyltransferase S [Frankliniella occidentalis]KAE8752765.1 hypothetical protein FOCC_FOCC000503 [Frankliniella occidentalis]